MRSGGKEERGGESRKQLSIEESGRPSFDYYKEKEIDIMLSTQPPTPFPWLLLVNQSKAASCFCGGNNFTLRRLRNEVGSYSHWTLRVISAEAAPPPSDDLDPAGGLTPLEAVHR